MTVDELIVEVSRRGLRINNLFQLDDGRWQANITDGVRYWEFGKGETPTAALITALNKSVTETPEIVRDRPIRTTQEYKQREYEPANPGALPEI